ncbi:MAG: ATP-binding cassette domain-containing protein [Blautia sp.]|nr:ATP-binding cassette domain-containing protein [Lachnoclostridium sp.]MCM1210634.1 ATP-binding cassette domain-containing protein [Blautia sp.]
METTETIIQVSHLMKYFKEVKAVDDISFQIKKGELFGFLGVNGAGKSTTINMLCTLLMPTQGEVTICGYRLGKEDEKIRRKIGVVYQNNCLDERLSVRENLFVRGALYETNRGRLKERILDVCEILDLGEVYGRRFAKLSGGQKRRCEIARALVNTPEILFLDEPTTGLDPATRKNVWQSVEKLQKDTGMTVFLTTHYMEEAARASQIAILDSGHIKEQGTPYSLKEKYANDKLTLLPADKREEEFWAALEKEKIPFYRKEDCAVIEVKESLSALPMIQRIHTLLGGFELVKGSMDDVFLNVTGKALEEAQ